MSTKAEIVKGTMIKAYNQMVSGCGNKKCLNLYCKVDSKLPNQIAAELVQLAKESPDQDLCKSAKFVFCEQIEEDCPLEQAEESQIIRVFSDPRALGSAFLTEKFEKARGEIDWAQLSKFYDRTIEMVTSGHLKPKWLEASIQCFSQSPYKDLYLPRAFLIILNYPLLSELEYSEILVIIAYKLTSSPQAYPSLSLLMDLLGKDQIQHLNWIIQQAISIKILQNLEKRTLEVIQFLLRLLECVYNSNERKNRINFTEFYNDAVNKEISLKVDFKNWYREKYLKASDSGFAFAFFPWILDSNSKSEFLNFENIEVMRQEIRNSVSFDYNLDIFVHLTVRREHLIEDTLSQLLSGELNIKKPLKVHFAGEEGVDEGGVRKEFFQLIVRDLFDPEFSMFKYYENQRFYWFNPDTIESNLNFELIGMILGMAIYNSIILDVHLPMATYKKILGLPTTIDDLEEFNPDLAKGLKKLLEFDGDVESVFCNYFYIEIEAFGAVNKHSLKENGENIAVNKANRQEYVDLYVDWWLNKGISPIFEEFKSGFLKVCGGEVLKMFKPQELELLICGNPVLDFKALESVAKYEGFTKDSQTIKFFWEIIHSFDDEGKRKFLCFTTGSDRAPINGLGSMELIIAKNGPDSDRLMTAHTCFNYILLPEYADKAKMKKLIITAINNAEGFGLR